jgi:hypothetical protein
MGYEHANGNFNSNSNKFADNHADFQPDTYSYKYTHS